jgi:hypothetical protein
MMDRSSDLSLELRTFLVRQGISRRRIATYHRNTRLWHDMGEYGEVAEDILNDFCEEFSVDYSAFEFNKYFPNDNVSDSLVLSVLASLVPFLQNFIRTRREYSPFTLGMLDDSIKSKRLV